MAGGVEFLGRFEHGLGTEGGPGIVSGKQCLEFADDLLGGSFRDQVAFDFERLENAAFLACPRERPRRIHVSFWQKDLTGLMEALRPQSPALLAAGAFGGNFQIGSFSLSDGNSFLRG